MQHALLSSNRWYDFCPDALSVEYNFESCKEIEACQLVTVIAEYVAIYGNKNKNIDKSYGSPGEYDGEVIETMEDLFLLALFEIYTKCIF